MKKIIVIPTYNEKENLPVLVKNIFDLRISDLGIIVVDDNSPDGTGDIARELSNMYNLEVIERKGKLGLGSAYIVGFRKAIEAGAEVVFEMDADGSHDPSDLSRMINEVSRGYDVVIGSRRIKGGDVKGWSWRRNFQSKCAMGFARFMLGLKTKDITAGFRCIRVDTLKNINLSGIRSNGYAFQEELIYRFEKNRFKIKEIPVVFIDRELGKSKLGIRDIVEFFATIIRLRMNKI